MKHLIITLLTSVCYLTTWAAFIDETLAFKQYSLQEGLSQSTVYDIKQDALGYLWVATDDGLNKFDGDEFEIFRHNRHDSTSLISSFTRSLIIDSEGYLWVGTQNGLSCYNKQQNNFCNYPFTLDTANNENLIIFHIAQIDKNYLLATNQGLISFNKETNYSALAYKNIRTLIIKRFQHHILFGSNGGLFYYFPETDSYELVHNVFRGVTVVTLLPHAFERNKIWVGTEGQGLFLYDIALKQATLYKYNENDSQSLSSDFVRSLAYDSQNRLWVGTFVGLNISKTNGKFQPHFYDLESSDEISQNSIRSIFKDNQGGMWCGTYFGGLNYYHPMRNRFQHICSHTKSNSLNDNVIGAIMSEPNGDLWIGTNDNGLNYYNYETKSYSHFTKNELNKTSIPDNNIKALLRSTDGDIYVGTHAGGLSLLSEKTGRFTPIPLPSRNAYSLLYNQHKELLIGTLTGLYIYNENSKEVRPCNLDGINFSNHQILTLFSDSRRNIWIGTDKGIYLQQSENHVKKIIGVDSAHRKIHCISEDRNGNIWIGTREGLLFYDVSAQTLTDMYTKIGFPEMVIYGILEDNFSQLWISTNSGLVCFNRLTNQWRTYTSKDGIQSNQFNHYAYCKTTRGRMYFGGINGITAFYPERMVDNPFTPAPIIDKLSVMGKKVLVGDDTNILTTSIDQTKKITLRADQSIFTLELATPNFLSGGKNSYMFRLLDVDEEWVVKTNKQLNFAHLPSGKYTLQVRAVNNDGKWSEQITELQIEILPEWWATWWAILIFIVSGVGLIMLSVTIYTSRKLMVRRLELEQIEKKQIHELNEAKVRFFINIAHEFKTPLTLIMSPLQEILRVGVPNRWVTEQLEYIMRNCKRLLGLISQTLDYRRSELGILELRVNQQPLAPFIREVFDLFSKEAERAEINYNCIGLPDDESEVLYDANYLERILSNLISNAFKHTPQNGSIDVVIELHDEKLLIQVHDTGCGIAAEHIEHIFERFYQVEENTRGTGIGLSFVESLVRHYHGTIDVKSKVGEGTVFTVTVPIKKEAFSEKELITENNQYIQILDRVHHEHDNKRIRSKALNTDQKEFTEEQKSLTKKRIMVVEDNAEVCQYLTENFSKEYTVEAFENGAKAWEKLNEQPNFDLIISDLMMPEMDGTKLCKLVKQNIRFCHIPIVILTAKADLADQENTLSLGADDYIAKPFVFSLLRTKVRNLFKSHQRILQHYAITEESNVAELVNNPLDEEFLKKAIQIIEKNMDNPEFSTEDFSSQMHMSRSNLYLKLKALTGESAVEFIRRIRFSYACKLLKEGRYNVSEISTMIGFTPSYFATSFKKYMGCLPSEYVKK